MRGLIERLRDGAVICAQGYVFELERRGYVQAGPFVPTVVLDHPEVVTRLHHEYVRAGSDVVEALTYYAHREKLKSVGKEGRLAELNRSALQLARDVAREHGALLAGNISNTNIYEPGDSKAERAVRAMFDEQVGWAIDAGVDYVIAETFSWCGEARLALEAIRAAGVPAVVTFAVPGGDRLLEGDAVEECCRRLEDEGAAVVGLNCFRGPATAMPLVRRIRDSVRCPVAALPVPYRTTAEQPTFLTLRDPASPVPLPDGRPFPTALEPLSCNRYEMAAMAREAWDMGVRYIGGCCGTAPHHVRAIAEALGRRPPASEHSPDMSKHAWFGESARRIPGLTEG